MICLVKWRLALPCRFRKGIRRGPRRKKTAWARNKKKRPLKLFSIILDPALNQEVHQIHLIICSIFTQATFQREKQVSANVMTRIKNLSSHKSGHKRTNNRRGSYDPKHKTIGRNCLKMSHKLGTMGSCFGLQ